ncbi:MAG TPA: hypothetical protein VME43_30585 [Bryobacteraceae bacterium]|nr:hypothetical protein [Bryobacteraceae bacterium]
MKVPQAARTAAGAAALFAINALLTLPLFFIPYTREMGSIEAAFIGLARYIGEHFGDLNWFPLWYGGIPFPDSYPPLLHFTVAAVAAIGRISPALAYHAVTALVYALAPVTLFWAAWRLGAGRVTAWLAGLGYSLLSPSCWLIRVVRADAGGWFAPRRLGTLVKYGEGPHLTALLFLPLAVGMVHVALEKRRPIYYVGASLAVAAVVLSNWIGAFALSLALSAYLLAGFGKQRWPVRWLSAAAIGVYAYALAMPWMTPSTIATIRANAPLVGGRFVANLVMDAAFAAGLLLAAWGLARLHLPPAARFGLLFLYSTAFITLAAFYFHAAVLPQPERYHLEMDLAFWLAVAGVAAAIPLPAPMRPRAAFAALLVAAVPLWLHQHRMAREMEKPIAIQSTVEYEISHWLASHPQGRVFAPGSIGFWMNAFSDTPMLTGGFDNGERNNFLQDVIFQIYAGDKQQTALDWLNAFGCDAVVGGAKDSREVYHPYAHPEKFSGLPELWREGGDVLYQVPRARPGLAHVVRATDLPAVRPPGYDTQPLKPYLAALGDPTLPPAALVWRGQSAAAITADLRPEYLLSVQVTYDEGWHASVNGVPRRVWGDKLGQLVVEPRCAGPCTVDLTWDSLEMRAARWVSRAAMALGLLWILLWRKRSVSTTTN